jgi:hypothetical protein
MAANFGWEQAESMKREDDLHQRHAVAVQMRVMPHVWGTA